MSGKVRAHRRSADRASHASHEAPSGLRHAVTIPCAEPWLSKVGDGVYAVFDPAVGRDIGYVERYYPTLESGHTAAGCPYRRWTAKRAEWKGRLRDEIFCWKWTYRTRTEAMQDVIARAIEARRAIDAEGGVVGDESASA